MTAKFNFCISNPPYQRDHSSTAGKAVPRDVYPMFQLQAMKTAETVCMIYPSKRWLQWAGKDGRSFGKAMLIDHHLVSVVHYEDATTVFENVSIQDGIAITVWSVLHSDEQGFMLNDYYTHRPKNSRPIILDENYRKTVERFSIVPSIRGRVTSRSLFGLESNHLYTHPNSMLPLEFLSSFDDPVKVLTIGLSGRVEWLCMDRSTVPAGFDAIDLWKVVVSSSHPVRDFHTSKQLLRPGEIYGRCRVSLAQFSSEVEARNFLQYTESDFFARLFKLSPDGLLQMGVFVPDLLDYTNKNPMFQHDIAVFSENDFFHFLKNHSL